MKKIIFVSLLLFCFAHNIYSADSQETCSEASEDQAIAAHGASAALPDCDPHSSSISPYQAPQDPSHVTNDSNESHQFREFPSSYYTGNYIIDSLLAHRTQKKFIHPDALPPFKDMIQKQYEKDHNPELLVLLQFIVNWEALVERLKTTAPTHKNGILLTPEQRACIANKNARLLIDTNPAIRSQFE